MQNALKSDRTSRFLRAYLISRGSRDDFFQFQIRINVLFMWSEVISKDVTIERDKKTPSNARSRSKVTKKEFIFFKLIHMNMF